MKLRIYVLLVFLSLITCRTYEEQRKDIRPLEEIYSEDIEKLIKSGAYTNAFQDIAYLRRENGSISISKLNELEEKVFTGIKDSFYKYIDNNEYESAYRLFSSLSNIGKENMLSDWSYKKIVFNMAEKYEQSGYTALALQMYIKSLKNDFLDKKQLDSILQLAVNTGNKSALKIILDYMGEKNIPYDESYQEVLKDEKTKSKMMMEGTVLVWVDKGIKIENGYGVPDIVMGSGFFVDKNGYILTNHHIIESEVDSEYEGYSKLYVRLSKNVNEKIPAKVIGYDRIFDLALLKLEIVPEYVFYSAGDVIVEPGDKVSAIGAPLGLENTLTSGIVSNVSRRFIQIGDVMQIDAPVNPGNSGGPLLDEKNNVVGVVFAGLEMFEGLNFAIPYNWVNKVFPDLFIEGEVKHAWLGIAVDENETGLEVIYTVPEEPAWNIGMLNGDIIESVNGKEYKKIRDIQEALLEFKQDTLVKINWRRDKKKYEGIFSLKERPFSPVLEAFKRDSRNNIIFPLFGIKIKPVHNFLWETEYVVEKVTQGSIADNAGISVNDSLNVQGWQIDKKNRIAVLKVFVKKKKAGFFESILQLAAYLETDNFI